MQDTNHRLQALMRANNLSASDVAQALDVAAATVTAWTAATEAAAALPMPESELRLLQYALMTGNKRAHLF